MMGRILCSVTNTPINGLPQDRGGGGGHNPREFDFMKLYLGRDFDIHNCPLSSTIKYCECPSSLI